jgi:antitoxin YobK
VTALAVDEAIRLIRDRGDAFFAGPRADDLIVRAQAALGLRYPPSYHRFIEALGAGSIGSFEVYGVTDAPFDGPIPDGVWLTLECRNGPSRLPSSMLVIGSDGMGGDYVLDTALGEEPPVEVWNGGRSLPDDQLERVADDFGSWLLDAVREQER